VLIRDQLSPTDFCNCTYDVRATKPCNDRLLILAGTETSISFLFLNMPRPCLATRVTCGEPRFVRSCRPQCWFVSVTRVCPTVMPTRSPHHRTTFIAWCVVRIDVHGSKDRAKDASPERMRRSLVPASGAYALWRMPTTFPSSAPFWTFAVTGASSHSGGYRYLMTDRPRPSFQQHPAKVAAFQKIRMPFTVTTREGIDLPRRDCSLRPSRRLSRSRRPHFVPGLGTVFFVGHCKCHGAVTRGPRLARECKRLFCSLELPCLGLTTQACQRDRPTRPSTRTDCLARTDASRSA